MVLLSILSTEAEWCLRPRSDEWLVVQLIYAVEQKHTFHLRKIYANNNINTDVKAKKRCLSSETLDKHIG